MVLLPAPFRVPIQTPIAPSVTSVRSVANDRVIIPGAVHISLGIYPDEENPGKPQLGDHLMKWLCDQSSSQIGLDRTARQEVRRKEKGWVGMGKAMSPPAPVGFLATELT